MRVAIVIANGKICLTETKYDLRVLSVLLTYSIYLTWYVFIYRKETSNGARIISDVADADVI